MFYAEYSALWWFVAGLLVVNLMLVRMGIRIFNREAILAKEMDELSLKAIWREFKHYFMRSPLSAKQIKSQIAARFSLYRFYRYDIPHLFKQYALPFGVIMLVTVLATRPNTPNGANFITNMVIIIMVSKMACQKVCKVSRYLSFRRVM